MTTKQWVLSHLPDAYVNRLTRLGKWYQQWMTITGQRGKLPRYKKGKLHVTRIFSKEERLAFGVGDTEVKAWQDCKQRILRHFLEKLEKEGRMR